MTRATAPRTNSSRSVVPSDHGLRNVGTPNGQPLPEGCLLRWKWIPRAVLRIIEPVHPSGPVLSRTSPPFPTLYPRVLPTDVASAAVLASVNDMSSEGDQSWQDVYASYGCSLEFDASDDGGERWQPIHPTDRRRGAAPPLPPAPPFLGPRRPPG